MRRFTLIVPLVLVLALVNLFGTVPVLGGAQDATPQAETERSCVLTTEGGVTEEPLAATTRLLGNPDVRLTLSRLIFSETEPGAVTAVDCAATEVYYIEEGSLVLELTEVAQDADGTISQGNVDEPCAGGCGIQEDRARQPLTLSQGDTFTHDGGVSYTIRNEAVIRADPSTSRGCGGSC